MRRILFALILGLSAATMAQAAHHEHPVDGMRTIRSDKPFDTFVNDLKAAVKANGLGIVAEACATCGAKKIGVTIPGNRVIMVFHPTYAVRMLKASVSAGIEAPLRLYVTEQADGTATLTYRMPSAVFAPYKVAELDVMAKELDRKLKAIAMQAQQ